MNPEPVAETFDAHADWISTRYLRFVAMVEVAVGPGLWWTIELLHPEKPALVAAYRYYQVAFGIAGVLTLGLLRLRSLSKEGRFWLSVFNVSVVSAGLGISCALAPIPNDVPFHAVPCGFFMVAWSLRQRAISMTAATAAFAAAACIVAPQRSTELLLINVCIYYAFAAFFGFLMGNLLYRVVHETWRQRRALSDRATTLEELNRAKTELVANVSHELRTPLTLILGALEQLRAHAPEVAERGLRNAGRLTVLVDDMLELARFDAGHGAIERRRGDLAALVREVVRSFEPLPDGGVLVTRLPNQPLTMLLDSWKMRTVLFNLVANAIKFTDAKARRIEVSLEATPETAVLVVRDNGAGIPKEKLPRILDRFYQVDATETRRHGGVGIGLALTQEIVTAHEGRLTVESELGVGSSFRVELPRDSTLEAAEPEERPGAFESARRWGVAAILHTAAAEQPSLATGRAGVAARGLTHAHAENPDVGRALVLIAEDDADLREYLVHLVSREHQVLVARDGAEAEHLFDEHLPDLVVADLMMPGRTGADLLRHVRTRSRSRWVPVLILTARTEVEVRLQVFDAGADDYLAKPFDERELLARIRLLLKLVDQERRLEDRNVELAHKVDERTEQLRRLALHLDASREDERRRIARELHDELGQLLTGIRMEASALRDSDDGPQSVVRQRVDGLLDQAFAATRNLVYDLRPQVLDDLGLVAAVEWYVERFRDRSGLDVTLDISVEREPSAALATTLFRALQEALTNVARHAHASHVAVSLVDDRERVVLSLQDDGCGFNVERTSGFGVLGLRERAMAAGGTFSIESGRGDGTRLQLAIPRASTSSEPPASSSREEAQVA